MLQPCVLLKFSPFMTMSSGARSGPNNSTPGLVWKKPIKNPEIINKCHEESGFFHLNTGNILFWYVIPVSYLNYHHMIKIYLSCCAAIFEIVFLVWLNVSNHVMFIWHKLIANKCYSICNVLFVLLNAMYSYNLCFIFFGRNASSPPYYFRTRHPNSCTAFILMTDNLDAIYKLLKVGYLNSHDKKISWKDFSGIKL